MSGPTRRRVPLAGAAFAGSLAGCASDGNSGADGDRSATDSSAGIGIESGSTGVATRAEHGTAAETTAPDGLDLREANVGGAEFEGTGDGSYRFDVTLHHDDEGEDGYANW